MSMVAHGPDHPSVSPTDINPMLKDSVPKASPLRQLWMPPAKRVRIFGQQKLLDTTIYLCFVRSSRIKITQVLIPRVQTLLTVQKSWLNSRITCSQSKGEDFGQTRISSDIPHLTGSHHSNGWHLSGLKSPKCPPHTEIQHQRHYPKTKLNWRIWMPPIKIQKAITIGQTSIFWYGHLPVSHQINGHHSINSLESTLPKHLPTIQTQHLQDTTQKPGSIQKFGCNRSK